MICLQQDPAVARYFLGSFNISRPSAAPIIIPGQVPFQIFSMFPFPHPQTRWALSGQINKIIRPDYYHYLI